MSSWLDPYCDTECCDLGTVGLTFDTWCFDVPVLAVTQWRM